MTEQKTGYYTAVIHGVYNPNSECYELPIDDRSGIFTPGKQVERTVQRLKEGYDHITADPVHGLTRFEAAHLLANADQILKDVNGIKTVYPSENS